MTFTRNTKGFLLVEVMVASLILAVALSFFMISLRQLLQVSDRSDHATQLISGSEELFFQIENGLRTDLAGYGGEGVERGMRYRLEKKSDAEFSSLFWCRLFWKEKSPFLEWESHFSKAPAQ